MEKRLQKLQQASARIEAQRMILEKKEEQRKKQDAEDDLRREQEAAEEATRQKALKAQKEFEEKEYQSWLSSQLNVLNPKQNTYSSLSEKVEKCLDVKKVLQNKR